MGIGIGLVAAKVANINQVNFVEPSSDQKEKAISLINKLLEKDIQKKILDLNKSELIKSSFKWFDNIDQNSIEESNFIIEAVPENFELKNTILKDIMKYCSSDCIIASNTSSISITKLTKFITDEKFNKQNFIGMHFMNPVPIMKLVEIIPSLLTSKDTLNKTLELAKAMNKIATISKDYPGFIANRLLMPYINEAIIALEESISTKEDIDTTMLFGTNMPMGPLRLADFIGLDTCLSIMNVLHSELGDSKYRPATLLKLMVDANYLGKKSGKGFYDY